MAFAVSAGLFLFSPVFANNSPVISSLAADPAKVVSNGDAIITCTASDPDSDPLDYIWIAGSGTITGTGAAITWSAPASTGTYMLTCEVSDGLGGTDQENVNVLVNNPPVISALTATPMLILPTADSTATCTATDPDNLTLTYNWTASAGNTTVYVPGNMKWTAPASTGAYLISCEVSDGEGGVAQQSVIIGVSTSPVILSLTAAPDKVSTGAVAALACDAAAPDNGALTYSWTAASGTLTGIGANVSWTAPNSTGTFPIGCQVTAGNGGTAQQIVYVLVNNPPAISALTGSPPVVSPTGVSTITCTASDPDNPTLYYDWFANGGSTQTIAGDGSQMRWIAPASPGQYTITCGVSDGEGGSAQANVQVMVATGPATAILNPMPGSYRATLAQISGTAAGDFGVSSVTVSIKKMDIGKFWSGAAWDSNTAVWFDAAVYPSSWTIGVPLWVAGVD